MAGLGARAHYVKVTATCGHVEEILVPPNLRGPGEKGHAKIAATANRPCWDCDPDRRAEMKALAEERELEHKRKHYGAALDVTCPRCHAARVKAAK